MKRIESKCRHTKRYVVGTTTKWWMCPSCGEGVDPPAYMSKSVVRRKAAQRGEPIPDLTNYCTKHGVKHKTHMPYKSCKPRSGGGS